jgi:tetratricopeptide (TPR) repeat protein
VATAGSPIAQHRDSPTRIAGHDARGVLSAEAQEGGVTMEMRALLDEYEARGIEESYAAAKRRYDSALAETPDDPILLRDYGYLQECHGRRAIEAAARAYERAIELDPTAQQTRLQLIHAQAALGRSGDAVALYRRRVAERPDDVAELRYLAYAYLAARDFEAAARTIADGLVHAPADARLVELRGDVLAATGSTEPALACWQRALELDPENLSPRYSSVFLLEREGRLDDAAAAWRSILDWCEERGYELDAEWPRRELARLEAELR